MKKPGCSTRTNNNNNFPSSKLRVAFGVLKSCREVKSNIECIKKKLIIINNTKVLLVEYLQRILGIGIGTQKKKKESETGKEGEEDTERKQRWK